MIYNARYMLRKFAIHIHTDYTRVLLFIIMSYKMRSFGERVSGRVEKIKALFWPKAQKVVEEKSHDLLSTLSAQESPHTEAGYPYIDKGIPEEPKVVSMDTNHQDKESTAMAA